MKAFVKGALALSAFGAILAGCNGSDDDGGPNPGATATATSTANANATATPVGVAGPNLAVVALVNDEDSGDRTQRLYVFNAQRPAVTLRNIPVTGLPNGEDLVGIDYRPANRALYAVSTGNRIYVINTANGLVRPVGPSFGEQVDLSDAIGFDFNPVPDRIRVISSGNLNFRVNPNTGAAVDGNTSVGGFQRDADLAFASTDTNAGRSPVVTAVAYSNNVAGATSTTNYAIENGTGSLVTQGTRAGVTPAVSPNVGTLFTVGPLGLNTLTSFDISRSGAALASTDNTLYSINLNTGAAQRIGGYNSSVLGGDGEVIGLAITN